MKVTITPDYITMYQSPFSPNELKYFMSLMQNDTKATGKGATYAKIEVLLSKQNGRLIYDRSRETPIHFLIHQFLTLGN